MITIPKTRAVVKLRGRALWVADAPGGGAQGRCCGGRSGQAHFANHRDTGPCIQRKTRRDNVGKVPLAAGAGSNLQRLTLRRLRPEGCESFWDWHVSPFEQRQGGNASSSNLGGCYRKGNARAVQRGSGHLAAFAPALDFEPMHRGCASDSTSKPASEGACTRQRLSFALVGKAPGVRPRSEPEPGNPAFRDRRGARGNVAYGGTRNPFRKRKRENGHSSPKGARAPALSRSRSGNTRRRSTNSGRGCTWSTLHDRVRLFSSLGRSCKDWDRNNEKSGWNSPNGAASDSQLKDWERFGATFESQAEGLRTIRGLR
jgi:hypothetical protein